MCFFSNGSSSSSPARKPYETTEILIVSFTLYYTLPAISEDPSPTAENVTAAIVDSLKDIAAETKLEIVKDSIEVEQVEEVEEDDPHFDPPSVTGNLEIGIECLSKK